MNDIFLGRNEEQQRFQNLLESLIYPASVSQKLPKIFLLHGFGGMGKTTLLKRLYKMIREGGFQNYFNTLFLDWEEEREYNIGLQVEHDNIQPATVLEVLYQKFVEREEWQDYFQKYSRTQTILQTARTEIKRAEEEQERTNQPVQPNLTKHESDIYKNSEKDLAEALGAGIAQIAQEKPLLIFFDTYELIDRIECDDVLRDVMNHGNHGGERVVWVIAGRSNLADNIWRNEAAKEALSAALSDKDPDIVAVAIRSLGSLNALEVPQLIDFLNLNKSKDRYVREAAARELGYMAQDTPKVLEAVEPLINTMRNDYMKQVREAASEVGGTIYFATKNSDFQKTNIGKKLQRALILAERLELEEEELEETDIAKLIQDLNSADDIDSRERIISKLGTLQAQEAVRPLVNLLEDPNEYSDVRATAAAALGEIGTVTANDDYAIQALIKALDYNEQRRDNDSFVRLQSAKTLGKLIPPVAIDALYKAIRQDKFSNVRDAEKEALKNYIRASTISNEDRIKAFNYLKLIYPKDAEKLLQENIPDSEVIREQKTVQQGNFDHKPVSDLITNLNNKNNPDECVAIANALGKLRDSRALKPLINKLKELEEGDWVARWSVIQALGNLETSINQLDETELVQKILVDRWRNDAISNVRDAVENALENIYKRTRGYKPAEQALEKYSADSNSVNRLKSEIFSANNS